MFVADTMETTKGRPPPTISAAGNGEERAEQIRNIQERVTKIRRAQQQMGVDVQGLTDDVRTLTEGPPPAPPLEKAPD